MFVPPSDRGIGMVFQSYAIWPHMTVFENVAFPLRVARDRKYFRRRDQATRSRALEMVRIARLREPPRHQLSGGQQQRLALRARARARAEDPAARRAAVQPRRQAARADARRAQAPAEAARHHHGLCHPRPVRGAGAVGRDRRVQGRARSSSAAARRTSIGAPTSQFVADFIGSANFIAGEAGGPARDGLARSRRRTGRSAAGSPPRSSRARRCWSPRGRRILRSPPAIRATGST